LEAKSSKAQALHKIKLLQSEIRDIKKHYHIDRRIKGHSHKKAGGHAENAVPVARKASKARLGKRRLREAQGRTLV
jgi:hypothetical protein